MFAAYAHIEAAERANLLWENGAPVNDMFVSAKYGLTAASRAALVAAGDSSGTFDMAIINDSFGSSALASVQLWNDAGTVKWALFSDFLGAAFVFVTADHTEADEWHTVEIASVLGVGLKVRIDGDDYGTVLADAGTPNAANLQFGQWGGITDGDFYVSDVTVGTTYGASDLFADAFASEDFTNWTSPPPSPTAPSTLTVEEDTFPAFSATVVATAATNVSARQATLNGTVNPGGEDTTSYFQYGRTVAYGGATTPRQVGAGVADVPMTETVKGLQPDSVYHYRLVAIPMGDVPPPPLPPPPGTGDLGLIPGGGFPGSYGAICTSLGPSWIREDNLSAGLVAWAASNNCGVLGLGGPMTMGLVNTYPTISWWEYDNEPYFRSVNLASWAVTARNFGATFKAAYPAKTLILPMLVQTDNGDYPLPGGGFAPWANQVFDAAPDIGTFYDGWSAHPYSSPRDDPPEYTVLDLVRSQLVANGFSKNCFITEVGWSVGGGSTQVTQAQQATYIGDFIDGARTRSWVEQIYIYSLHDQNSSGGFEQSFGMFNASLAEKLSAAVFRSKV